MIFKNARKRKKTKNVFMQKIDADENLVSDNELDYLIDTINIMSIKLKLTRALIINLYESIYDFKLYK